MLIKYLKSFILYTSFLLPLTSTSYAHGGASPMHVTNEHNTTRGDIAISETNLQSRISTLEKQLSEVIQGAAGQISAYVKQAAHAEIESLTAQTQQQAQISREEKEVDAIIAHKPSAQTCSYITGASGLSAVQEISDKAETIALSNQLRRITSNTNTGNLQGGIPDTKSRYDKFLKTYCDPEQTFDNTGLCSGTSELHNADIAPENLFQSDMLETSLTRQAALDYIDTLIVPVVKDPPTLGEAETDAKRQEILLARSKQSHLALAQGYMAKVFSDRQPAVNLADYARALTNDTIEIKEDAISKRQLLKLLTSTRFENPRFFTSDQAESSENLLRKIIQLLAFQSVMQWENHVNDEYMGSMMAVLIAQNAQNAEKPIPLSPLDQ